MMLRQRWIALGLVAIASAACKDERQTPAAESRTLRVVSAEASPSVESVTLTGSIAARVESKLSFRTGGRVVERLVDVGDRVQQGQVLARLDLRVQAADVESARAAVAAAEAQVTQAVAAFGRADSLLREGFTTRRQYDAADEALKVARANLLSSSARLVGALEAQSYTELRATANGIVTSRELDVGETAQAATTAFMVALDGPRDAVFDLYEGLLLEGNRRGGKPPEIRVSLTGAPSVEARGQVRQVSPTVNPQNGTVRVKVGLESTPAEMSLGSVVTGTGAFPLRQAVVLPSTALTALDGRPAVWVRDKASGAVAITPVRVARYEAATIVIEEGLHPGDQVVVDGVKLLRPGQRVAASEEIPVQ
jgi:membrane fusion protein, multidrug efflux system